MDPSEALRFLEGHHRGVMSTLRVDGRPQLSPVLCATDSAGRVVVSTRQGSAKVRNLRRNPWIGVCVLSDTFFGRWIYVEGSADIVELPEAMEPLVDYYRRISGEHEDWDDYRNAMRSEGRLLVRFTIERAGPGI
jgi:PPOX class probable F420-dependent enzyme